VVVVSAEVVKAAATWRRAKRRPDAASRPPHLQAPLPELEVLGRREERRGESDSTAHGNQGAATAWHATLHSVTQHKETRKATRRHITGWPFCGPGDSHQWPTFPFDDGMERRGRKGAKDARD
jgi:hypothetical protein